MEYAAQVAPVASPPKMNRSGIICHIANTNIAEQT
jgi:hypothetical protein